MRVLSNTTTPISSFNVSVCPQTRSKTLVREVLQDLEGILDSTGVVAFDPVSLVVTETSELLRAFLADVVPVGVVVRVDVLYLQLMSASAEDSLFD